MKLSLVQYLAGRENGRSKKRSAVQTDDAHLLAEEKATLPTQNQSCELSGQCRSTFLMTFSPDGNKVASTHGDHSVRVTEVKSGKCLNTLHGHPRTPWCVAFHPSSSDILASGCLGGEVRIWDLRGGGSEVWKSEQSTVIASISFHPTDQILVIATANKILFWDWTRPAPFASTQTGNVYERVRWVKFDPWGHFLYTGIANATQAPAEETEEQVSYVSGNPTSESPPGGGGSSGGSGSGENRGHLQERYRHLVDQITNYQRDRVQTGSEFPADTTAAAARGVFSRISAAGGRGASATSELRRRPTLPITMPQSIGSRRSFAEVNAAVLRRAERDRQERAGNAPQNAADIPPIFDIDGMAPHSPVEVDTAHNLAAAQAEFQEALRRRQAAGLVTHHEGRPIMYLGDGPAPHELVADGESNTPRTDNSAEVPSTPQSPPWNVVGGSNSLQQLLARPNLPPPRPVSPPPIIPLSPRTVATPPLVPLSPVSVITTPSESSSPSSATALNFSRLLPYPGSSVQEFVHSPDALAADSAGLLSISSTANLSSWGPSRGVTSTTTHPAVSAARLAVYSESSRQNSVAVPAPSPTILTPSPGDGSSNQASSVSTNQKPPAAFLGNTRHTEAASILSSLATVWPAAAESGAEGSSAPVQKGQNGQSDGSAAQPFAGTSSLGGFGGLSSILRSRLTGSASESGPCSSTSSKSSTNSTAASSSSAPVIVSASAGNVRSAPIILPATQSSSSAPSTSAYASCPKVSLLRSHLLALHNNDVTPATTEKSYGRETSPVDEENSSREASPAEQSIYGSETSPVDEESSSPTPSGESPLPELICLPEQRISLDDDSRSPESKRRRSSRDVDDQSTSSGARESEPSEHFGLAKARHDSNEGVLRSLERLQNTSRNTNSSTDTNYSSDGSPNARHSAVEGVLSSLEMEPHSPTNSSPITHLSTDANNGSDSSQNAGPDTAAQAETLSSQMQDLRERCRRMREELHEDLSVLQRGQGRSERRTRRNNPTLPAADSLFPEGFMSQDIPRDPRRRGRPLMRLPRALRDGFPLTRGAPATNITTRGLLTASSMTSMSSLLSPALEHPIEHMEQQPAESSSAQPESNDAEQPEPSTSRPSQEFMSAVSSAAQNLERRASRLQEAAARQHNLTHAHNRQLRRRQRLRQRLEIMKRRYNGAENPRVLPEGSSLPPATSRLSDAERELLTDAERELGAMRAELSEAPSSSGSTAFRDYMSRQLGGPAGQGARGDRHDPNWIRLGHRHLHPHYSISILDETINRQNDFLQAAINRAIAGAFMGVGESAVASNIVNVTHRIQRWDVRNNMPAKLDNETNVIVSPCKLHNDASVDISANGELLAAFVPSHRGFPDDTILGVFSLRPSTLGQCLYTKSFGPNAISLSISPLSNYVLVGLAAKRLAWVLMPKQMVAQVYKLKTACAGEDSMEPICDLMHPCGLDIRTHVSVNSARWLPNVGDGIVYGTNKGDLHICRPGDDETDHKSPASGEGNLESQRARQNLMQMLGLSLPSTSSTSTQTQRVRRSASTQTDHANDHE